MLSDEIAALAAQDIATTVAAGNAGAVYDDGVNVIAADPNAIGVSAVDRADRFTTWSQKSETLTDVAALGRDVVVDTVFGWGVEVSGTSFAAPYVAGTAARLQDAAAELLGERLDPAEVVRVMTESGRDVRGAPDDVDGYTVADADAAVEWFVEHHATFADDALIA
jgi:subtilisin family serine protease